MSCSTRDTSWQDLSMMTLALGWGVTKKMKHNKNNNPARKLQAVKQTVLPPENCEELNNAIPYPQTKFPVPLPLLDLLNFKEPVTLKSLKSYRKKFLREYELCVKQRSQGICQGDSGGPLICEGTFCKVENIT